MYYNVKITVIKIFFLETRWLKKALAQYLNTSLYLGF